MHFYQQNIADYRKKTMGLSPMEHGVYRLLMDTYYMTEQPLELDLEELMRSHSVRTADEQIAFKYVLKKFFQKTHEGYRNKRCDKEIESFYAKSEKARQSAKARWNKDISSDGNTDAMRSHGDCDADGMLPHNLITPLPKEDQNLLSPPATPKADPIPYQKIIDSYHAKLPSLPKVLKLSTKRKAQIGARWRSGDLPDLETWDEYFDFVAKSEFLMGKTEPAPGRKRFIADLEWLTNESNFTNTYERKYHGR